MPPPWIRRLLGCAPYARYERCDTEDPDAPPPPAGFHRPAAAYDRPCLPPARILERVRRTISQAVHVVVYAHGSVYICPVDVAEPARRADRVLREVDAGVVHYVVDRDPLRLVVFGPLENYRGLVVVLDPEALGLAGAPHQALVDVARMFLIWDREDRTVVERAVLARDPGTVGANAPDSVSGLPL